MSRKTLYILVGIMLLLNCVSLYFLFRPRPQHFRRPPSIIGVLDLEEKNSAKIKQNEDIHFTEKGKLMDEIKATKQQVYILIGKNHTDRTLDSLLSIINSKHYQAEKMTFDYFKVLRTLLSKDKQKELDKFVIKVIANNPRPPHRK